MKKAISILLMVSFVLAITASGAMATPYHPAFTLNAKVNGNYIDNGHVFANAQTFTSTYDANFGPFSGAVVSSAALATNNIQNIQGIIDNDVWD